MNKNYNLGISRLFLSFIAIFTFGSMGWAQSSGGFLQTAGIEDTVHDQEDVQSYVDQFLEKKYGRKVRPKKSKAAKPKKKEVTQEKIKTNKPQKRKADRVINTRVKNASRVRSDDVTGGTAGSFSREQQINANVDRWSLGLAAGQYSGMPMRMAVELSNVVDDGKKMNVIPMLTKGPSSNVHALLFTRGVDLAIINADILGYYKRNPTVSNVQNRVNYITQLFHSEVHVLVRPEIETLDDLFGKVVNFNTKGSSASYTGPEIFKRLGIRVKKKFLSFSDAVNRMTQSDEISAMVIVTGKQHPRINQVKWPQGFRLLPIKYSQNLTDYYLPTVLNHEDYPNLVPKWETVETIAVPTLLVSYNWKRGSARYRKVERFVDYMFSRWGQLTRSPNHAKWKTINLATKVPGWKRLPLVQSRLNRAERSKRVANGSRRDRESVDALRAKFEKFLKRYAKAKNISRFTPQQREELFRLFYQHSQGSL